MSCVTALFFISKTYTSCIRESVAKYLDDLPNKPCAVWERLQHSCEDRQACPG